MINAPTQPDGIIFVLWVKTNFDTHQKHLLPEAIDTCVDMIVSILVSDQYHTGCVFDCESLTLARQSTSHQQSIVSAQYQRKLYLQSKYVISLLKHLELCTIMKIQILH